MTAPATATGTAADTAPGTAAGTAPGTAPDGGTGTATTLLTVATGLVGALSYGTTMALAHLLPAGTYTATAAAAALVGTAGVAAAALVPLPLARAVRTSPAGSPARTAALGFAVGVSLVAGLGAAVATLLLVGPLAGTAAAVAAGLSAWALFAIAPVWGLLQGEGRFGAYAALTVVEVLVRVAVTLAAALLGAGVAVLTGAWAAGALAVLVLGLGWSGREVLRAGLPRPAVLADRTLWAETAGVAAVQALLSLMTVADVVVLAALDVDPVDAAGYQAVAALAKAPVWIAVSAALVGFPAIRAATGPARARLVRAATASFVHLVVPAAAVVVTVPPAVALLVLPDRYAAALDLLPALVVAGVSLAVVTVLATLALGAGEGRRLVPGLAAAAGALAAGIAAGVPHGVRGLALGAAAGSLAAAVAVAVAARPARGRPVRSGTGPWVRALLVLGVLALTRVSPVAWTVAVVLVGLLAVVVPALAGPARAAVASLEPLRDRAAAASGLRIVHLGFEDPAMPGAGGGSLRTAETGRRLAAAGHHLTVLTTRFEGARDRVEEHGTGSLCWVHLGVGRGRGRLTRLLGYVLTAPAVVRSTPADLVVEDFFAPVSSMAAPWWSGRPTVGVVQWLNAREKWREYRVPVHLVEKLAVRSHRRVVAVSQGVAERLAELGSPAEVTVVGNGIDLAVPAGVARGHDVVFVGRLETAQKGLDLLLDAWAQVAHGVPGRLVLAGSGPDEQLLRERVAALGIADRVTFAGWVRGADKAALLAGARVAVVPSRFETFGIVAVEALACGTPVVAFDIPCLREVVPAGCGLLPPLRGDHAADVAALAAALSAALGDPELQATAARRGPAEAARWDWDALTAAQEAVYLSAAGRPTRAPAPHTPGLPS